MPFRSGKILFRFISNTELGEVALDWELLIVYICFVSASMTNQLIVVTLPVYYLDHP